MKRSHKEKISAFVQAEVHACVVILTLHSHFLFARLQYCRYKIASQSHRSSVCSVLFLALLWGSSAWNLQSESLLRRPDSTRMLTPVCTVVGKGLAMTQKRTCKSVWGLKDVHVYMVKSDLLEQNRMKSPFSSALMRMLLTVIQNSTNKEDNWVWNSFTCMLLSFTDGVHPFRLSVFQCW